MGRITFSFITKPGKNRVINNSLENLRGSFDNSITLYTFYWLLFVVNQCWDNCNKGDKY